MTAAYDALITAADPAMAIVTVSADGEAAGCLVGFHTQCSIDPRRHAIWLSKANRTYEVALRAEHVAVHFPTADRVDLARHFGTTSGDEIDKFAGVGWSAHDTGVPILDGCPNRLVGRRVAMLDDGSDHVAFTLEVVDASHADDRDLLGLADVVDLDPGHDHDDARRPRPR